jgi:hypothetical protein
MEKRNRTIFMNILFGFFMLAACSKPDSYEFVPVPSINFDNLTIKPSMKGWELYSWTNGNDFNYSLLPGTNRLKSYNEIIGNKLIVFGKDSLIMLLDKLPANENIFLIGKNCLLWIQGENNYNFSLPGKNTINDIKAFCNQKGLTIDVCE